MIRIAPLALATLLAASAPAFLSAHSQAPPHFTDPANLRGERVSPRTGRELPIDQGTLGLEELLRKLNTRASILNIVAHPDDEDGGMLTLYARGYGARVADLSLTRGEGGQNAMTGDFEDALGLLRTQELLSNDRYTGVTQMFGTEVDFGFSKTKAESFAKWTHQRVLYDAVRAIRLYRPLVITATFIGNPTDGHGQHQVSGEIAQEAFVAAGDPNIFPELTKEGILPWQPLKMYARVPTYAISAKGLFDYATGQYVPAQFTNYVTGKTSTTPPTPDIVIHEGTTDPLLTKAAANYADLPPTLQSEPAATQLSYVQFARIGLGLQKSQIGPGVRNAPSGRFDVPYHLYGSCVVPSPASEKLCHLDRGLAASSQGAAKRPASPPASPNSVILSVGSQASSRAAVEGPRESETSHNSPPLFDHGTQTPYEANEQSSQTPTAHLVLATFTPNHDPQQAPKARPITAQGNALGTPTQEEQRAEGPLYNPALASQPNFFDGIDTSLEGIATLAPNAPPFLHEHLAKLSAILSTATSSFDPNHPEKIAPSLAEATVQLNQLLDRLDDGSFTPEVKANLRHELRIKRTQLNDALLLALGLRIDPSPNVTDVQYADVPVDFHPEIRQTVAVKVHYVGGWSENGKGEKQLSGRAQAESVTLDDALEEHLSADPNADIGPGGVLAFPCRLNAAQNPVTRPYFYRDTVEQPVYKLSDSSLRGAPEGPPAITCWARLEYDGVPLLLGGVQVFEAQPALNIRLFNRTIVVPRQSRSFHFTAVTDPGNAPVRSFSFDFPKDWTIALGSFGNYQVTFPQALSKPLTLHATAIATDGHRYTESFKTIGYLGLPTTLGFKPAEVRIVPVNLNLPPHLRVAYIPGTGDDVAACLKALGIQVDVLSFNFWPKRTFTAKDLAKYDTIILGVRTYNAHPELHGALTQALLDYARNGGNVLVQYQTAEFTAADAPFPLSLGSDEKVVDETAPVEILHADSPRFTTPNHIVTTDFDHWIEERGHGFLASWDPHYTALTETHDPGQAPQKGGLITVQLGRGHWTYCAFALYRQLPEAVPGAFRLFVNLLTP